jgi:trans-L-3-hydroxyproline dehydratase
MYGALLVEPRLPEADLAVLFMHNEGYSTMCGHAVIALGRYAIDAGIVALQQPKTVVNIECPCGLVRVEVDATTREASFLSVPAFVLRHDQPIDLGDGCSVHVDISYGGAFYAVVEDRVLGVDIEHDSVETLTHAAATLTQCVKAQVTIAHADSADLAFLYGTIITDGKLPHEQPSRNLCVFADSQVDRSPTGSGVTARMALAHAKKQIEVGDKVSFVSIVDSIFTAEIVATMPWDTHDTVHVEVTGKGYYTGRASFCYEEGDELGKGFLCR